MKEKLRKLFPSLAKWIGVVDWKVWRREVGMTMEFLSLLFSLLVRCFCFWEEEDEEPD